jgi:BNR/Asp-box repeat.
MVWSPPAGRRTNLLHCKKLVQRLLVLLAAVVFSSCGVNLKRAAFPVPPAPPAAQPESEASEREDSYKEAAEFYLLKRTPPGEELPVERYLAAKLHAERMPLYSLAQRRFVTAPGKLATRNASLGAWQALGPGNIGGRTRSLLINPADPKIMYAGSVGGGVWKTTDSGTTWNPLSDLLPSIGIGSMAMDPQDPNVLYAGTGESYTNLQRGDSIRGMGIFKSTDAGATWNQLPGTAVSPYYYVNKIVISPNDSGRIYAATGSGIFISQDAGATWRNALSRTGANNGCQDLVIRTDQPVDYLFAACGGSSFGTPAVFRNTNAAAGGQWEAVLATDHMGRTSLALAPSSQSTVYALAASTESGDNLSGLLAVYRSDANGDAGTWNTQTSNQDGNRLNTALLTNPREAFADVCTNGKATYFNQGDYDNTIAVDPVNPDVVWAGGIDLFRSDDGGRNWGIASFWQAGAPQLSHADNHGIVFAPGYNGGDNQTLFAISDGGVYRTDNARADTATGDRAACSPYPTKIKWTSINNGYAVTQFYHGAVYPGGGAYIAGAQDNGTNRGSDSTGPLNWLRLIGGDGGMSAIDPNDPNILFGEATNLSLMRSTNGGTTFSAATAGVAEPSSNFLFIAQHAMDPADSKRMYIGGKTLWRTTDGAVTWSAASSPIPSASGSVSAIAISASDPNRVVFGTSTGFVYRSSAALSADQSTDWDVSQPRSGYLSHLTIDPSNPDIVYATYSNFLANLSQSHVYKSTDGGARWTGIDSGAGGSTGLPDIPVFTLIVDPQNPSTLYLGTDIGVFVSLDGGGIWARDDNPFANAVTETLVLDRSAGQSTLFAFTHGRGVWKVALPGSGEACQYAVSGPPPSFSAYGGSAALNVTTGDNCAWSAFPGSVAAVVQSPAGGVGSGPLTISTPLNATALARTGTIFLQDKTVAVKQDAPQIVGRNDEAAAPQMISTLPYVSVEDTRLLTLNPADPVHSCTQSADFKTAWWRVVPAASGDLNLGVQGERYDIAGNSGVVLTVYDTTATADNEIACIERKRDTGAWQMVNTQVAVTAGKTYLIEVSATGATAVDGGFTILAIGME